MEAAEWPPPKALELLKEMEEDPQGWAFSDVDKLLDRWGVTDPLPDADPFGYRARRHPQAPDLVFYFQLRPELARVVVENICRQVRTLERRLKR